MQRRGARILAADAGGSVVLTVTENPTEYMGIVQIRRKESVETLMEILGPIEGTPATEHRFSLTLHEEFLFSQDVPILDVVMRGKRAYALGMLGISTYELRGESWTFTGAERLPVRQVSSREPRGFLYFGIDSGTAYSPGEMCRYSALDGKGWSCEKYRDTMPVRSVSPEALAGKKLPPWFSAAQIGAEEATKILVTGQDGLALLYEDGPDPVATFPGWGSEIASVQSGCGSDWQLLVSGKNDWTGTDSVQALELPERQAKPVSSTLELAGAVIALHSLATKTADDSLAGNSAVAVIRNLKTGRYDAYRIAITCPN